MFEQFFGLTENPFNLTPDPKFLFLSEVHKEAMAHLQFGIIQRKGFILLTGEVGAGKTTVCRALMASLTEQTHTALILNPTLSDIELLQSVNQEFGINASHTSKKALLDELNAFLLRAHEEGKNVVLIIDECQNLTPTVLEQIRMLSNLETEKDKLLQIIMIGQPELNTLLAAPNLRQLNDRIVLRYHMRNLSVKDTRDYIAHRLFISGAHDNVKFTRSASKIIFNHSQGLPRRINALAERAMLIAYLNGTTTINRKITAQAYQEVKGEYQLKQSNLLRFLLPASTICVLFAVAVLLLRTDFLGAFMPMEHTPAQKPAPVKTAVEVPIKHEEPTSSWILSDYESAKTILSDLTTGQYNDIVNLHPAPDIIKYISRPFIASIEGGYCVIHHATLGTLWMVGPNNALIEIPLAKFQKLYRWTVHAPYTKDDSWVFHSLGSSGPEVAWLQSSLVSLGYLVMTPNGIFDVKTEDAIKRVQEAFGLKRDGVAGSDTMILLKMLQKGAL